jgi:YVTN family beta-propeller protein
MPFPKPGGGGGAVSSVFTRIGAIAAVTGDYTVTQITGAAPLASPPITGTPTAPTAVAGTNTTQLANTAFVTAAVSAGTGTVSSVFGRTGVVVATTGDYAVTQVTGAAPLASPTFTGTPAAPTAATGTNTTQLATTAFVIANAGSSSPFTTSSTKNVLQGPIAASAYSTVFTTPALAIGTWDIFYSLGWSSSSAVAVTTQSSLSIFGKAITTVTVGANPNGVAVTPNGSFVYVTNYADGTVSVIATSSNTVVATVTVGSSPNGVAVTPNGSFVYVTNYFDGTVSVIATSSNTVVATVTVGSSPIGVAVTPNGSFVYVTNISPGTVSVIATSSNTVVATVTVGSNLIGVAVTPNGSFVYVANQNIPGTVSVIATSVVFSTSLPVYDVYTPTDGTLIKTSVMKVVATVSSPTPVILQANPGAATTMSINPSTYYAATKIK